jgi:hypothetical protein
MSEAGLAVTTGSSRNGPLPVPVWIKGLLPLGLLGVVTAIFLRLGPIGVVPGTFPPVEALTIERITLPRPGEMQVRVVNGGPEPSTTSGHTVSTATGRSDGSSAARSRSLIRGSRASRTR